MGTGQDVEKARAIEAVDRLRRGENQADWFPELNMWQDMPLSDRRQWLAVAIEFRRPQEA